VRMNELYWLAGLLEGEGSFMQGPPSDAHRPLISVEMTDEDVIARVSVLFKTKVLKPAKRGEYKQTYTCRVTGDRAAELMRALRPYMGLRRQKQIDKALSCYVPGRNKITEDTVDQMVTLVQQGMTHAAIAEKLSLCRESVTRHLCKRYGGRSVAALHI